eukprot:gene1311-760_t
MPLPPHTHSKLFIFYTILSLAKKRGSELFSISAAFIRFLICACTPPPLYSARRAGAARPYPSDEGLPSYSIPYETRKTKKRAFKKAPLSFCLFLKYSAMQTAISLPAGFHIHPLLPSVFGWIVCCPGFPHHYHRLSYSLVSQFFPCPTTTTLPTMSCGDAKLNHPAPAFDEMALMPNGTFKKVSLASYKGKWVVLFFYPMDFTFVCPTEICQFSDNVKEFNSINCEVIACSMDSEYSHLAWTMQDRKKGGLGKMEIPIIADKTKSIIRSYGCLKEDDGVAYRGVFIIDPRGNLRQFTVNDLPVGRSVEEVLRLVKAFQFVEVHGEVCPANWKPGAATMKPDPKASVDGFFSKLFIFYTILSLAKKRGSELFSISAAFIRFLICACTPPPLYSARRAGAARPYPSDEGLPSYSIPYETRKTKKKSI